MIKQGEILRLAIKGTGKTVEETALLVGVARGTLYNYFKLKELDDNTRALIKKKLGIEIEQNVQDDTFKKALKEPTEERDAGQPPTTLDNLATALLTANKSVGNLTDSIRTAVDTNAQLANHVMQHVKPSNSDELKMLSAMWVFLHNHIISKGLMAQEEVRKELDTIISAQSKVSSIAYSFGI